MPSASPHLLIQMLFVPPPDCRLSSRRKPTWVRTDWSIWGGTYQPVPTLARRSVPEWRPTAADANANQTIPTPRPKRKAPKGRSPSGGHGSSKIAIQRLRRPLAARLGHPESVRNESRRRLPTRWVVRQRLFRQRKAPCMERFRHPKSVYVRFRGA